ncbi:MAG TPA: hypothetical protein DEB09_06005 [Candidatus Magasanikbacteria bacterium]|nr:hypothetical protein [Candidatus Magasanikbacteria bacterium]
MKLQFMIDRPTADEIERGGVFGGKQHQKCKHCNRVVAPPEGSTLEVTRDLECRTYPPFVSGPEGEIRDNILHEGFYEVGILCHNCSHSHALTLTPKGGESFQIIIEVDGEASRSDVRPRHIDWRGCKMTVIEEI